MPGLNPPPDLYERDSRDGPHCPGCGEIPDENAFWGCRICGHGACSNCGSIDVGMCHKCVENEIEEV